MGLIASTSSSQKEYPRKAKILCELLLRETLAIGTFSCAMELQEIALSATNQKISRRLELSISKSTPHVRWGQGPAKVPGRFASPAPEIVEFVAFRDSGKFFQQFSRDFPGLFLQNPNRPQKQPQPCRVFSNEACESEFAIKYR